MEQIKAVIRQMIDISADEMQQFLGFCSIKAVKKRTFLSLPDKIPHEVFFINKGILRVLLTDKSGDEHTMHFATENQFIADYSNFILQQPATYALQALEDMEVVVLPRQAIEWGYQNLRQGDRMGRLIAEYYFIYQENRIKNGYIRTPKERYDLMADIFPDIHNRAPQQMLASYLGITPVHLSRLKKAGKTKP